MKYQSIFSYYLRKICLDMVGSLVRVQSRLPTNHWSKPSKSTIWKAFLLVPQINRVLSGRQCARWVICHGGGTYMPCAVVCTSERCPNGSFAGAGGKATGKPRCGHLMACATGGGAAGCCLTVPQPLGPRKERGVEFTTVVSERFRSRPRPLPQEHT